MVQVAVLASFASAKWETRLSGESIRVCASVWLVILNSRDEFGRDVPASKRRDSPAMRTMKDSDDSSAAFDNDSDTFAIDMGESSIPQRPYEWRE